MTLDELKQSFDKDFLGNSNEVEFVKYLKVAKKKNGDSLSKVTIENFVNLGGDFFRLLFKINIFEIQQNGLNFLDKCRKEMEKGGCLYEINYNDGRKPFYSRNYTQYNGHPISCLKWYMQFLQQNGDEINHTKSTQNQNQNQDKGEKMNDKIKNPPLNQILYGPPGTGKTYNTINKALEILSSEKFANSVSDRDEIVKILKTLENNPADKQERQKAKSIFEKYKNDGQIEFITFHQSFSYEEFVEGIKPIFVDENGNEVENSNNMVYKPKDGIFKKICKNALDNLLDSKKSKETLQNEKIFENKLDEFLSNLVERQTKIEKSNKGSFYIKDFDETRIYIDTQDTELIKFLNTDFLKNILRSNEQFDSAKQMWKKITNNKNQQQKSVYYFQLYKLFQEFKPQEILENIDEKVELQPYILIIDEINRGNISKILGELITLIEPSKRIGGDEELRVSLPYSENKFDNGNGFGVPSNLYIIGTMNTADRSIALLDTALRRRFEFVEMMPEWNNKNISTNCEGVNLQNLLKTMNARIEFLLDREHTIGHSFFIGVDSMEALREVFGLKIIPLLQEYFYDDYAKIDAVLNGNGMIEAFSQSDLGVKLSDDFVDSEKRVYRIVDSNLCGVDTFIKIYKSKDSSESSENE